MRLAVAERRISRQNIALGSDALFADLRTGHRIFSLPRMEKASLAFPRFLAFYYFLSRILLGNRLFFSFSLPLFFYFHLALSRRIPRRFITSPSPSERSLTRAFYVRRARFSAVIDTTSGGIPLESIELIQPGDFNLMRNAGRARARAIS